jgi:pyruvate dehydrogenase E2 component (dihydrolipoamide acetyltransferase)
MATEVLLVKAGMTMTEGTVALWYVPDGGEVKAGELLYRMETEKIELEVEAEAAGTVRHTVPVGTTVPPGALIAYLLAPGEAMPAGLAAPIAAAQTAAAASVNGSVSATPAVVLEGGRVPASPIARRLAKEAGVGVSGIAGTGPGGRITEADVLSAKAAPRPAPAAPREALASPLARKLAEALGVNLGHVAGTGPGGRITKEDVEAAVSAAPATTAVPARTPLGDSIPLRGMRKVIAERMHASLQEMAQLTMGMEVTMDDAVKLRTQLLDEWAADGIRVSYTDLVIKAVAKALRQHPLLNATMTATEVRLLPEIHIGMAVALDNGLVVPVVRNADALPLKALAEESGRLSTAARTAKLGLDEMAGGTFSVTALGMAGVDFFTPVINPPNVAILGVGRIHDAVAWDGDRPVKRQQMTLSLTIDHRAVDGAPGAAFLATVKELLEAPFRLLV